MIQRSIHFEQLDLLVDLLCQDSRGRNVFLALLQPRFDFSDPGAIATLMRDSDKIVVLREAIGDFPPEENLLPEQDNGAHNSALLQESTNLQIGHLYSTGELIHPCDGGCDPD